MFDSHCHLDFDAYAPDRETVWQTARRAGVTGLIVPAYAPSGWQGVLALQAWPGVRAALGIHPWALAALDGAALADGLAQLASAARQGRAVAIGECGLDGVVARRGGAPLTRQREAFEAQLEVARTLSLPVIVHVVRAHGLALEVLRARGPLPAGGVLHGYGGSPELVREYAALGLSFSFSPAVLRSQAKRMRASAVAVPDDRLLVESDGPDQHLPERERGEPADIARVCEALADLRGSTPAALRRLCEDNARALFRL